MSLRWRRIVLACHAAIFWPPTCRHLISPAAIEENGRDLCPSGWWQHLTSPTKLSRGRIRTSVLLPSGSRDTYCRAPYLQPAAGGGGGPQRVKRMENRPCRTRPVPHLDVRAVFSLFLPHLTFILGGGVAFWSAGSPPGMLRRSSLWRLDICCLLFTKCPRNCTRAHDASPYAWTCLT